MSLTTKQRAQPSHRLICRSTLKKENDERLQSFVKEDGCTIMPEDLQKASSCFASICHSSRVFTYLRIGKRGFEINNVYGFTESMQALQNRKDCTPSGI